MKKILILIVLFFGGMGSALAIEIDVKSEHAILYSFDKKEVLFEKASKERTELASLTKMFTTFFAIENIDNLDDKVVVKESSFTGLLEAGASVCGLKVGDIITYRDLLYCAILPSGADATRTLSINLFGSDEKFAEMMTKRMKDLGLQNTNFKNSHGLTESGHYSTVEDIFKFMLIALENKTFRTIYETDEYITTNGLNLQSTRMTMALRFGINIDYITGSKSGFTYAAGVCFASTAEMDNTRYLLITTEAMVGTSLKPYHLEDAQKIYNYVFENYGFVPVILNNQMIVELPLKYGKEEKYKIKATEEDIVYGSKDSEITSLFTGIDEINVLKYNKGDKIGVYKVYADGKLILEKDIFLDRNLDFSYLSFLKVNYYIGIIFVIIIFITIIFIRRNHETRKIKKTQR